MVSRQVAIKDDGTVFYASFSAKAKLGERTLGKPRKDMYERIEKFVKKMSNSDKNLATLQQTADTWATIESYERSIEDLYYRLIIYVAVAFVFILAYSRNLIISLVSTLCYFMVLVIVLGIL